MRQATATFSRKKPQGLGLENAPYKIGDTVSGRYVIKDIAGAGPVGVVFRAHDREVDVEVALKVIHARLLQTAEERRHFARAMRLGRKLSHQNLIRVYEEGEDGGRPFFAMQFLEGLTLRKIIDLRTQKGQLFTLREVEPIIGQIASALDGAHKVGAHGNLKPENVIVLPDLLKVSDFGLSLAIPRLPFAQAAKGRKADRYLAPEYLQGHEVDQRADLYSLGVILGEMLSGLVPDGAIPELHTRNRELPPQVEGLYRRALNSNPLARPKTAGELYEELADLSGRSSPPPLRRADPPPIPAVNRPRPQPPHVTAAGPAATIELRRRVLEKPPPPVPEDLPSEEVLLNGSSGEEPVRSNEPTRLDGRVIPDPDPSDTARTVEMPSVALAAMDREETAVFPSFPTSELEAVEPHGDPTESRVLQPPPGRGRAVALLSVITLAGLAAGGAGGYWYLGKLRQPQVAVATPLVVTAAVATAPAPSLEPEPQTAAAPTPAPAVEPETTPVPSPAPAEPVVAKTSPAPSKAETRRAEEARKAEEARQKAAELAAQEEDRRRIEAAALAAQAQRQAEAEARAAEEKRKAEAQARAEAAELAKKKAETEKKPAVVAAVTQPGSSTPAPTPAAASAAKDACPDGMRKISAGSFRMGTARDDPMMGFDERTLSSVNVGDFCIDQYEFPNRRGARPRINVSWFDAKKLCEGQGKRLCSEEEWEKACKGPGSQRFPYGNTFDANACNTEDELGEDRPLAAAGRFGKCRSGYGVADMSGNVAEWTSTNYAGNQDKAQKGGSHTRADYASRCSARRNGSPGSRAVDVGFRCCQDL